MHGLYAEALAFSNGGNFLSNFSLLEIQPLCHQAKDPGDRAKILLNTASKCGKIHKAIQPLDIAGNITESCPRLYHYNFLLKWAPLPYYATMGYQISYFSNF